MGARSARYTIPATKKPGARARAQKISAIKAIPPKAYPPAGKENTFISQANSWTGAKEFGQKVFSR